MTNGNTGLRRPKKRPFVQELYVTSSGEMGKAERNGEGMEEDVAWRHRKGICGRN